MQYPDASPVASARRSTARMSPPPLPRAPRPAASPPSPPSWSPRWSGGTGRAGRFTIYGGPGVYLLGTRWASWTAATARATGELWGLDAKLTDLGHASIVLSAPKSHDGLVYYSALRIVGGKDVVHYWRWYWSGPDIGWTPVASAPG